MGLGFRAQGSGFRFWGYVDRAEEEGLLGVACLVVHYHEPGVGFRVEGTGCRVEGAGCRVQGSGCRVQGSGFRVQPSGCRV